MEPRLLTQKQAAEYCGYSQETFARKVREGEFPRPRAGSRRYDRKLIDLALDQSTSEASASDAERELLERAEQWGEST